MCVASLKSITQANKAKKALDAANIQADIIKLEPHLTKKGCGYGIRFNCLSLKNVEIILKNKFIKYSEIINY